LHRTVKSFHRTAKSFHRTLKSLHRTVEPLHRTVKSFHRTVEELPLRRIGRSRAARSRPLPLPASPSPVFLDHLIRRPISARPRRRRRSAVERVATFPVGGIVRSSRVMPRPMSNVRDEHRRRARRATKYTTVAPPRVAGTHTGPGWDRLSRTNDRRSRKRRRSPHSRSPKRRSPKSKLSTMSARTLRHRSRRRRLAGIRADCQGCAVTGNRGACSARHERSLVCGSS
jgi:hypothetical protein